MDFVYRLSAYEWQSIEGKTVACFDQYQMPENLRRPESLGGLTIEIDGTRYEVLRVYAFATYSKTIYKAPFQLHVRKI